MHLTAIYTFKETFPQGYILGYGKLFQASCIDFKEKI